MEHTPPKNNTLAPVETPAEVDPPPNEAIIPALPAITGLSSEVVQRRRSGGSAGAVPAKGRRFWEDFPLPSAATAPNNTPPED